MSESTTPATVTKEAPEQEKPHGPKLFGRFGFWIVAFPFIYYLIAISSISYLESLRIAAFEGTLHDHEESSYKPEIDIKPMEEEARAEGKRSHRISRKLPQRCGDPVEFVRGDDASCTDSATINARISL